MDYIICLKGAGCVFFVLILEMTLQPNTIISATLFGDKFSVYSQIISN